MSSESWHPINIQQLRQSLKMKWLTYYKANRRWLVRMQVWGTFNACRRPYSGFILATVTALEPKLHHILPFVLDLNNNPDDIIAALGLNFNPEEQLHLVKVDGSSKITTSKTTTVKAIENQTISQPSVPKPPEQSKALPTVTPIIDSFKPQRDKLPEQVRRERTSDRTIDAKVTTQSDRDRFPEQVRSASNVERQSFPQKPLPHPETRIQANLQKNLQNNPRNNPQNNPQNNIQKLSADTHQSISVTPKVEIKDTRGEAVPKKIGLNQPAKTEVQGNQIQGNQIQASNTFRREEKPTSKAYSSQRDTNNKVEQQPARVNKLAKWIDELCQDNNWEQDDMIFIRF